ncbi:hypothetical protein BJ875DRAFT_509939 [Amylocarpus encephaloides]|uniref:Transcription factor domain-containing protein n=1 Tax=Amylocarpus encephaloides TaxID=45428 RepID=A0A9P8BYQ8_9HELO|nr:hypothetical protein BJ875DRAFT_509939 [Amylocarpus encephaloides]
MSGEIPGEIFPSWSPESAPQMVLPVKPLFQPSMARPLEASSISDSQESGATRLLLVPTIVAMCGGLMKWAEIKDKYPIVHEEKREILRIYNRGEGVDSLRLDHSPRAAEECRQTCPLPLSMNPPLDYALGSVPDLSKDTVNALVWRYENNINMHPLLTHSELELLVESFLGTNPKGILAAPKTTRKRKRYPKAPSSNDPPPREPVRSMGDAIFLSVLTLGAITYHQRKLPDYVPDQVAASSSKNSSTIRDRQYPYTTKGMWETRQNNVDVIPGLFYFALASDVIRSQPHGNSLEHARANILACLYYGQLGRVLESHGYMNLACRGLQDIIPPEITEFRAQTEGRHSSKEDDSLVIAFWTCLQLERHVSILLSRK